MNHQAVNKMMARPPTLAVVPGAVSTFLRQFYADVLPDTGNFCLFELDTKRHVWSTTLDSLVADTEARVDQQGVYFGTASYIVPDGRTQRNVKALRCFRLDIDAGTKKHSRDPDGAYPTQRDALIALIAFSKAARLVPSYIVSSGEGLHVYYVLDEDLSPDAWEVLAEALGNLGAAHGLKIDSTCTTDTARILRPPGSLHPNGSRVEILADTHKVYSTAELTGLLKVAPGAGAAEARRFDMGVNDDVPVPAGPRKSLPKIIEQCPAMGEVAAARGDVPEPYWRAMLGVVKFTVEGIDAAHELSHGHPDYDPAETEQKFEAWTAGPTTCKEFSRHATACSRCEHHGKIKSPTMLGVTAQPAAQAAADQVGSATPGAPATSADDAPLPTDVALSKLYVLHHGTKFKFDHSIKSYLRYHAGSWLPCRKGEPSEAMKSLAGVLLKQAA